MSIDLRENIVAQFKMNDNNSSTALINKYGTNGVLVGSNTEDLSVRGKTDKGLYLAGGNYIDVNNSDDPSIDAFVRTFRNSFTINLWTKLDDGVKGVSQYLFGLFNAVNNDFISFVITATGGISSAYRAAGNESIPTVSSFFNDGKTPWHMITYRVEQIDAANITVTLYVDGDSKVSKNGACVMSEWITTEDLYIGGFNFADTGLVSPGFGIYDNFCLFNKAVSQEEITFLYNNGAGTELLYDITPDITNNNFFATIGDYDSRSTFPDNASKLVWSSVSQDAILRTANNDFNHIMVSGMPLSVSPCFFTNETTKFRTEDSRDFPNLTYFYVLDVIHIPGVSHQTLTDKERTTQFNDTKLFINRWNAINYLNTFDTESEAIPTDTTPLFGSTLGLGQYGELIFNRTSYTISQVEEFKEVAFMNNLVSVGRVGNNYYLIITT